MKVLRVINSLKTGGAERSIISNVRYHIENGVEMDVMLLDATETIFLEELRKMNVKIYCLGVGNNLYNPLFIFKIYSKFKKYDIVHGHLFPTLYWLGLAKFLSFSKVKLVFTEHSTHNRRRDHWITRQIDRFIYRQYKMIITISKAADDELKKHYEKSVKTTIINNGVDLKKVRDESLNEKPDIFSSYKNCKILLKIAGFRPAKDHDTLIRSLLHLPEDYVVFLVGDGVRKDICKQLAKDLGVLDRVGFLGLQSNIGAFIKHSDVVVMSSHWEGFGRAAVEGMALGKPVIATNVSGLKDIVSDAGLLFEVGEAETLSQLILKIMNDKKYYDLIAKRCLKRSEDYDVKKMVDAYEKIYYSLVQ